MRLIMSIHDVFFRTGNYWYICFFWLPIIISFIKCDKYISFIEQYEKSQNYENLKNLNTDSEEESNWYKVPLLMYPLFALALITVGCSIFVKIVEVPLDSPTFLAMFLGSIILNLGYLILFQFVVSLK